MKKILFAALALLLSSICAHAQLNVQSESKEPVQIAAANYGFGCLLIESPDIGYLLYLRSSNRYDKRLYFILGKELEGAIKTLEDMRELCDNIGDRVITVASSSKHSCTIMASTKEGWIRLSLDYQAGYSELKDSDLDIFIKELKARVPVASAE